MDIQLSFEDVFSLPQPVLNALLEANGYQSTNYLADRCVATVLVAQYLVTEDKACVSNPKFQKLYMDDNTLMTANVDPYSNRFVRLRSLLGCKHVSIPTPTIRPVSLTLRPVAHTLRPSSQDIAPPPTLALPPPAIRPPPPTFTPPPPSTRPPPHYMRQSPSSTRSRRRKPVPASKIIVPDCQKYDISDSLNQLPWDIIKNQTVESLCAEYPTLFPLNVFEFLNENEVITSQNILQMKFKDFVGLISLDEEDLYEYMEPYEDYEYLLMEGDISFYLECLGKTFKYRN